MNIDHDSILRNMSSLISAFVLDVTDNLTRLAFPYASASLRFGHLGLGAELRRVWSGWT